jgi:triacylglycerol lipase
MPMLSAPRPPRQHPTGRRLRALLVAVAVLGVAAAPVRGASPDPILLIHGYRGSAGNFSELQPWLAARGRTVVALTLPSQDNKVNAQYIKDQIAAHGWSRVDLVMHSMGGLSGRYFIKSLGGTATVQAYVSLGTPQYGVYPACVLPGFYGGQMCPWNSWLSALNSGDDTPNGPAWATIYSRDDEWVPFDRSRLDGGACQFEVSGISHDGLLHSPSVTFPRVLAALDDATDTRCPAGGVYRT